MKIVKIESFVYKVTTFFMLFERTKGYSISQHFYSKDTQDNEFCNSCMIVLAKDAKIKKWF